MKDNTILNILQYNVRKRGDAVQVPLLNDIRVQEFDIIAIQEPWRNGFAAKTYNPGNSHFHLVYCPEEATRVCLYVNKCIDPST